MVLAPLVSILISYFQYYFRENNTSKFVLWLFLIRASAIFLLILLLINPKIKTQQITNEKPELAVLIDNSKSISFFEETNNINNVVDEILNDKKLSEKFNINQYTFGNDFQLKDSLSFNENQTQISKGLSQVDKLLKNKNGAVVLITDGNQTIGSDYEFVKSKTPIYPVVFGDTVQYADVKITQLNVNKYSFINNQFPVEILLNYEGKESVATQFSISQNGKTIFRKNINFSVDNKSETISTNLTSKEEGLQFYTASLNPLESEKNTKNNSKNFSIEVIDEQTKILLLTSVLHPDLGTFKKAIESNKQRKVEIVLIDDFNENINDYQLVILYQPSSKFANVVNQINNKESNFLVVTGTATDWSFINSNQLGFQKNAINQTENYTALYNDNFLTFFQEDLAFSDYPPLQDKFGEVSIDKEHQVLLYQQINGLQTEQPLLSFIEENNKKTGILLGEGIWKWRAANFMATNTFQDFDSFLGNIVQYLAMTKKRSRLEVIAENLYPANSTINIAAFYTDKTYKFDSRASLEITVTNKETKKVTKLPFSLINNSYQVSIDNLPSGDYTYQVEVLEQNLKKFGEFKITKFEIEEQFTNVNSEKLGAISNTSKGKMFYKSEVDLLINTLLEDQRFFTVQKSTEKEQNLVDWKWILFLVIALFSTEWFLRKYYGKI